MTDAQDDEALRLIAEDRMARDNGERFSLDATMEALRAVAVDFDGVVHRYSQGWHDGSCYDDPMAGALEGVRTLLADRPVAIMSARPVLMIAEWFTKHAPDIDVRVDPACQISFWSTRGQLLITNRKIVAAHYIDDRSIRFTTWPNTLAMVSVYDREYELRHAQNFVTDAIREKALRRAQYIADSSVTADLSADGGHWPDKEGRIPAVTPFALRSDENRELAERFVNQDATRAAAVEELAADLCTACGNPLTQGSHGMSEYGGCV